MDTKTLLKLMLSSGSTGTISKNTGVSADQVSSVINSVLPQLLSGANAQATNKTTAASFLQAIENHGKSDTKDLSKFLGSVDTADGAKIIKHLLGGNANSTIAAAAKKAGVSTDNANQIMANAAPLFMSVLGQQQKKNGIDGSELLKSVLGSASSLSGKNSGIDLSDGIDAKDVIGILGKFVK